jgi:hypothetical protein
MTKSSNYTLSLHRLTSNFSSIIDFRGYFQFSYFVVRHVATLLTPWNFGTQLLNFQFQFSDYSLAESESYITADSQSACLSWIKSPVSSLRPDFYYSQIFACLLMWGVLSDDRTDLSFTIAPGPRQSSHFRVRLPWDSWPYFTVSDSRLPFSSPPTTRRLRVEVFDPISTREATNRLSLYSLGSDTMENTCHVLSRMRVYT